MAQISILIPDDQLSRVRNGFCSAEGFTGFAPGGAAETKSEFIRRKLAEHVKNIVKAYEARLAEAAARALVESEVNVN